MTGDPTGLLPNLVSLSPATETSYGMLVRRLPMLNVMKFNQERYHAMA